MVWYTLHKIYAGLCDAYLLCGNERAHEMMIRLTDWVVEKTAHMTDDDFERMLRIEHGGMNEVLADIYTVTGDERHLELAEKFCHRAVMVPLSEGRERLNGLHPNTQIPKFVGFEWLYEVTGKKQYHDAATETAFSPPRLGNFLSRSRGMKPDLFQLWSELKSYQETTSTIPVGSVLYISGLIEIAFVLTLYIIL